MLFPIWWWWAQGFASCLFPATSSLDRPEGMRILARALTFTTAVLSLSPHSEWRFLHPFLPCFILFALPPMFRDYSPTILGCYRFFRSMRQYTRLPKLPFYLCLCGTIIPWLYLNALHSRAQIEVISVLRQGRLGHVDSLVALMPCHSTPWMSHLHQDIPGWFLTCEPPLQ